MNNSKLTQEQLDRYDKMMEAQERQESSNSALAMGLQLVTALIRAGSVQNSGTALEELKNLVPQLTVFVADQKKSLRLEVEKQAEAASTETAPEVSNSTSENNTPAVATPVAS